MTTYRCASCGSPNVMTDTQAGGVSYDYKKGIIGTVVLGPGGAVAGVSSKSQTVYKCADCGMCLTYSMPDDLRIAIDLGVNNADMRKGIRLASGQQLSWNRLKQIYKNIESGFGDQQIARAESRHRNGLLSYATATQDEFDNAVDTLVDYEKKMSSSNGREHLSLTEYYVWQEALYTFIENAVKYLPKKLPEQYRGLYLGITVADSPHRNASNMLCYFFTYFVEKIALKNGGAVTLQQMRDYAECEPIILLFINWFFMRHFVPFGSNEGQDIPYTESTFHELFRWTDMPAKNIHLCFRRISPKMNGQDTCTVYLPPYVVKNGIIGHWLFTGQSFRLKFNEEFAGDYFRYNPEKQAEYDRRISEHNASRKDYSAEIKSCETKINGYQSLIKNYDDKIKYQENQISSNNSSIETIRVQIESLRKKIFGKKAALAKADELEQEIQAILQKNNSHSQEIDNITHEKDNVAKEIQECKKSIDAIKENEQKANRESAVFYDKLFEDMDYFVFWHWDSDEFRKMLEEKEAAEKVAKQNLHESSRYYISDEAQNARKQIEEQGIQLTENLETDILNYLSIVKVATTNDLANSLTKGNLINIFKVIRPMANNGLVESHTYDTTYYMIPGQFAD